MLERAPRDFDPRIIAEISGEPFMGRVVEVSPDGRERITTFSDDVRIIVEQDTTPPLIIEDASQKNGES